MNKNQTLKQRVIDYSYEFCAPGVHDRILRCIKSLKDDLSDLREKDESLYFVLSLQIKNKDLLEEIESAVSEKESKIDINSAFIGAIIGLLIGIAICVVVNLIPR